MQYAIITLILLAVAFVGGCVGWFLAKWKVQIRRVEVFASESGPLKTAEDYRRINELTSMSNVDRFKRRIDAQTNVPTQRVEFAPEKPAKFRKIMD